MFDRPVVVIVAVTLVLTSLGGTCAPVIPDPVLSVAGAYSGTLAVTIKTETLTPAAGPLSVNTNGGADLALEADGTPALIPMPGSDVQNLQGVVSHLSEPVFPLGQPQTITLPTVAGISSTRVTTTTALTRSLQGFHLVIEQNTTAAYSAPHPLAGQTVDTARTVTADGTITGNVVAYTHNEVTTITTRNAGAVIGLQRLTITASGNLTKR